MRTLQKFWVDESGPELVEWAVVTIILLVAAIVLYIASHAWQKVAPTALDVSDPGRIGAPDHGQTDAAEALGQLPNLGEMQQETQGHVDRLEEALAEIE